MNSSLLGCVVRVSAKADLIPSDSRRTYRGNRMSTGPCCRGPSHALSAAGSPALASGAPTATRSYWTADPVGVVASPLPPPGPGRHAETPPGPRGVAADAACVGRGRVCLPHLELS